MSTNKRFACRRADGKFHSPGKWAAHYADSVDSCWAPILENGQVVALVVAAGPGIENFEHEHAKRADDLVARLNGSEDLIEEVKALRTYGRGRDQLHIQAMRNVLKAIVEADDAAIAELRAMGLDVPPGACVLTDMARLALTMGES